MQQDKYEVVYSFLAEVLWIRNDLTVIQIWPFSKFRIQIWPFRKFRIQIWPFRKFQIQTLSFRKFRIKTLFRRLLWSQTLPFRKFRIRTSIWPFTWLSRRKGFKTIKKFTTLDTWRGWVVICMFRRLRPPSLATGESTRGWGPASSLPASEWPPSLSDLQYEISYNFLSLFLFYRSMGQGDRL